MNDKPQEPAPLIPLALQTPWTMLATCIEKGYNPDALAKLMDVAERWQANQAAAAYAEALAGFQADCPMVPKSRVVKNREEKGGSVRFKFAGFEDVMSVARPHLKAHRIAVTCFTPKEEGVEFTMVCRLRVGCHFEDHPFRGPKPDLAEIAKASHITQPQAYGLVLSYYKRYAFCAAAGVVVADEDNDAAAGQVRIDQHEIGQIEAALDRNGFDKERFLAWARAKAGTEAIADIDDLPKRLFKASMAAIGRAIVADPAKGVGT